MDRFAFAGKKACDAGASGACHAKLFRKGRDRFEDWQLFLKKRFWTARVVCRSSFTFARKKTLAPHDEHSIFYGSPWVNALRSERFALARKNARDERLRFRLLRAKKTLVQFLFARPAVVLMSASR